MQSGPTLQSTSAGKHHLCKLATMLICISRLQYKLIMGGNVMMGILHELQKGGSMIGCS